MEKSFVEWINTSLKPWLRIVLLEQLDVNRVADLDRGVELCKKEAMDSLQLTPSLGNITNQTNQDSIKINRIYGIKNAMGLFDGTDLKFVNKLSIVYGPNGSGKSSYVKLLKKVVDSSIEILPNVFNDSDDTSCFSVDYLINGQPKTFNYPGSLSNPFLFGVYDEDDGKRYIQEDNAVSIEPEELVLLKRLSDFADGVRTKLLSEQISIPDSYQVLPENLRNTEAGKRYSTFQEKEISDEELALLEMKESDSYDLQNLELSLKTELQEQLLSKLKNELFNLNEVQKAIGLVLELFSAEAKKEIKANHDAVISARISSKEYAEYVFSESVLDHIGEPTWKEMWKSAEKYSEEVYPGLDFPFLGDSAVCVLCHQPLKTESVRKRMISFKEYVRSDLEEKYKGKLDEWHNLKCFNTSINPYSLENALSTIKDDGFESIKERVLQEVAGFDNWKKNAYQCPEQLEFDFCDETLLLQQLVMIQKLIEDRRNGVEVIEKNQTQDEIIEINKKISELKAKEWVSLQKENLIKHTEELRKARLLKKAISLTSTNGITIKAKEISQKLLDETYVANFNDSIKMLGADRIRVCLVSGRAKKGRGTYRLVLKDTRKESKLVDILSSGERRIASLAAFIADAEAGRGNIPFVFDDPVNSLDNDYEESVGKALCQLSENRQVIVFTHKLSLFSSLLSICKKSNRVHDDYLLMSEPNFGAGIVAENPAIICSDIKKTTNSICNRIKEEYADCKNNPSLIQNFLSNRTKYCQQFRNLVEHSIEMLLFDGIVRRFDKNIQSKKVGWACHITEDDCRFIDNYMTEYSVYDHSQSDDCPAPDITYDKLIADYESLAAFAKDIKKRQSDLGFN